MEVTPSEQLAGNSVVSVPLVTRLPWLEMPATTTVPHGWVVSVQTAQAPAGFSTRGALFVAGGDPVVPLPEGDHGPSPLAFAARTCARYAVVAVSPVIVAEVDVPGSAGPNVSPPRSSPPRRSGPRCPGSNAGRSP